MKPERKAVYQLGNYYCDFPKRGDQQLTPEEAKKEREEIIEAINRNAPPKTHNLTHLSKHTDNEPSKNQSQVLIKNLFQFV